MNCQDHHDSHQAPSKASQLLQHPAIKHGFFGRRGGVSRGIYNSLNCGPYSGDVSDHVNENRRIVLRSLDIPENNRLVTLRQIHSSVTRIIDNTPRSFEHLTGDSLVTTRCNIVLAVLGADCLPVLFADSHAGVIAAAHAGWKGAIAGIIQNVVYAMVQLGAQTRSIVVAIGPGIQCRSYEVGSEMREHVLRASPFDSQQFFSNSGQVILFDLPAYVEKYCRFSGIQHIDRLQDDSCSDTEHYFSYRRNMQKGIRNYGRQISIISRMVD